jgi:hypothetical protein
MMWRTGLTVAAAALLSASGAHAQLLDVRQTIYGMD